MNDLEFNLWDEYPRYLTLAEAENPMRVLADFFSAGWLPDHLEELKTWRNYIIKPEHYVDGKGSPATLFHIYKSVLTLIDAAFLLHQRHTDDASASPPIDQAEAVNDEVLGQLVKEKENLAHYPMHLSEAELIDPYLVLAEFFGCYSLPAYRMQMDIWIEAALSNSAHSVNPSLYDLVIVYELLQRLYEAAYVLLERHRNSLSDTEAAYERTELSQIIEEDTRMNKSVSNYTKAIRGTSMAGRFHTGLAPEGRLGLNVLVGHIKREVPSVRLIVYLGMHLPLPTYYLLVIVDGKDRSCEGEISSRIEDAARKVTPLFTLVHKTGSFDSAVKDGNRFFNDALNIHPEIYRHPGYILPETTTLSSDVIRNKAAFYWNRWGELGKAFLEQAISSLPANNPLLTLHLLDQAASHILSGTIRVKLGYKAGNLSAIRLFMLTQMFTEDMHEVFINGDPENWELFKVLQFAHMQTHYRDKVKIDSSLLGPLAERVNMLYKIAKQLHSNYDI